MAWRVCTSMGTEKGSPISSNYRISTLYIFGHQIERHSADRKSCSWAGLITLHLAERTGRHLESCFYFNRCLMILVFKHLFFLYFFKMIEFIQSLYSFEHLKVKIFKCISFIFKANQLINCQKKAKLVISEKKKVHLWDLKLLICKKKTV